MLHPGIGNLVRTAPNGIGDVPSFSCHIFKAG
jgi:hypothetical protein